MYGSGYSGILPRHRTKKDLRAFLGTASYYRRFIPDFAGTAGPLFNALKKVAPTSLVWDNIMTNSFTYLISTLCSFNMLWLPRKNDHFTLHMDASLQGLGAELSVIRDGVGRNDLLHISRNDYFRPRKTIVPRSWSVWQ